MSSPILRKLVTPPAMLALLFLLFAAAAIALVTQPGPGTPVLALCLTGLAVVGVVGIRATAIRAREAELALGEGERYIEKIAELSQDIHAIMDAQTGAFLYLNPAVEDMLGFPSEAFFKGGMDFLYSLVHPDDAPVLRQQRETLVPPPAEGADELVQEEIYRIRNHHGAWRWFKSRRTVFVRYPDGRPAEILAVVQDITQQRAYESALVQAHKVESLGALVRGTVNDLNNTLMGIQGYAEMALEGQQGPDLLRSSLERVQGGIQRATGLCRQILAYTGQGRIQISPHQLNDAVRESLPAIESLVPDGAHLVLELQNDLPLASVDLTQARHALLNLVFNACEALGIRGGEITVRTCLRSFSGTEPEAQGLRGDFVCLEVSDTGPGTPPEVLAKVFDPLFTTLHPGHGLGLSTVEDILREHQGAVRAKGEPGTGDSTVLYFQLAEKNPEIDEGDEGTPLVGASGVLLLVDDEPSIRAILRQGFENAGFKVIEGTDGVDGFASFVRHRSSIDAVLLDLTMPRMGGDEVFEEIHKLAPEIPVVLMSGYSQEEATTALAGRGLAGFLSKPCSIKDALAVVGRALGSARTGAWMAVRGLIRFCSRHWALHRFLDPLYLRAEAKGDLPLVRENALRLLERAHVERLGGGDPHEAGETAARALDRDQALADRGDPDAAWQVAEAHRTGFGRPRNHWKALEHYRVAADLGHAAAPERLRALQDGEAIPDDGFEAFGRRALLKATYAPDQGRWRAAALAAGARELHREGLGRRATLAILAAAGLLFAYIVLDVLFGMGAWRPDPGRVVWGLFGKIHPPRGTGVGRVLPGWLRPDAGSVAFEVADVIHERAGIFRLADFRGKVVHLHVVDGHHPTVHEAVPFLQELDARRDGGFESFILYVPAVERVKDVHFAIQWALGIAPAVAPSAKAVRPLGTITTFPANFVIDRRGRIRQRWTGFSAPITEEAIRGALAEN